MNNALDKTCRLYSCL